jgi:3-oxoacyl-[acyl-carrier protein] reductase
MRLDTKTAIVTGAGQGFGEGIARRFAEEGAHVLVADLNGETAEKVTADINAARPGAALAHKCDVSDGSAVQGMIDAVLSAWGHLDIIVNNAGTTHVNKPVTDVTEDEFDRIMNVNVKAIWHAARAGVPAFRSRGGGVILNVASTAGVRPRPGLTVYNASKGAAITLTRSMAVELAPDNIRVVALNPVAGETPLLKTFMGEDTPEIREKFLATIPLGRFSQPSDMGNAAVFLCSDEADFLTGVCLEVDGGRCV